MDHTCSKCNVPMTKGYLQDLTLNEIRPLTFAEGDVQTNLFGQVKQNLVRYTIEAYRCPSCGFVENYANQRSY
jgi:hypothetical protein